MTLSLHSFLVVALLQGGMIIAPGSDYALVLRTVGRQGRGAGLLTALGFGAGALALLLAAALGVNAVFTLYPVAVTVIRYAGAAWLLWQGILCFIPVKEKDSRKNLGSFGAGFVNHFINIEMIIFYIAVMSQLGAQSISPLLQLLIVAEMACFTVLWFMFVVYCVDRVKNIEKVLNHLVTRVIFGALFLISAIALVRVG